MKVNDLPVQHRSARSSVNIGCPLWVAMWVAKAEQRGEKAIVSESDGVYYVEATSSRTRKRGTKRGEVEGRGITRTLRSFGTIPYPAIGITASFARGGPRSKLWSRHALLRPRDTVTDRDTPPARAVSYLPFAKGEQKLSRASDERDRPGPV